VKPPSFARNVNRLKPVDANNSSVPHPLGPLNLGVRPLSRALLPELDSLSRGQIRSIIDLIDKNKEHIRGL